MAALLAPRPRAKSRGPTGGLNCERDSEGAFSVERTLDGETVTEEPDCRAPSVSRLEADGASLSTLEFADATMCQLHVPTAWEGIETKSF